MAGPGDFLKLLPKESILSGLNEVQRVELMRFARQNRVAAGKLLFSQGDPGDSLLVVLTGTLKVFILTPSGREVVLDYVSRGGLIGEIAVLDGGPRTAGVMAVDDCQLLMFRRADLLPFLSRHLDVALRVIEVLCARLRRTNDLVEASSTGLAMGPKLARGLLRLARTHHGDRPLKDAVLPIRQSDLAAHIGVSRENANRQLREWAEAGTLSLGRGRIVIHRAEDLEEIGSEAERI